MAHQASGTSHEHVPRELMCPGHAAYFYLDHADVVDQVAQQSQAVLHHGHAGIVIASNSTLQALATHCSMTAHLLWQARVQGRLQLLDAELCIGQLTVAGPEAASHFRALLAQRIQRLAGLFGQVHVYSELVSMLCERNEHNAAMSLEEAWVELARERRYDLICGYSMNLFERSEHARKVERLRCAHDRVIRR